MSSVETITEANEFAAFADILSQAIQAADRLLKQFKMAPATTQKKRFALITLNEIVRKCKSVEAMARPDAWAGIAAVTRAAFESYADLLNLLKIGDEYADYMIWVSLNQMRVYFQSIGSNPNSPYLRAFDARLKYRNMNTGDAAADMQQEMEGVASRLPQKFKTRKGGVISTERFKFELAGILDDYNALHRRLSGSVHGRISDMLDGVFIGEEYRWPPGGSRPPLAALDCLCGALIESCRRTAKVYRKPAAPIAAVKRMRQELKRSLSD